MEFSEFAKRLKPIIGDADNVESFVRTLFDAVVDEDGQSAFEEYKDGTLRGYYYGSPRIDRFAKKIYRHLDLEAFIEYIDCYARSSSAELVDAFSDAIPNISDDNASKKISELFVSIIVEAAHCKGKKNMDIESNEEVGESVLEAETLYEEPNREVPTPVPPQFTINMIGEHSKIISNCETVNIYD